MQDHQRSVRSHQIYRQGLTTFTPAPRLLLLYPWGHWGPLLLHLGLWRSSSHNGMSYDLMRRWHWLGLGAYNRGSGGHRGSVCRGCRVLEREGRRGSICRSPRWGYDRNLFGNSPIWCIDPFWRFSFRAFVLIVDFVFYLPLGGSVAALKIKVLYHHKILTVYSV